MFWIEFQYALQIQIKAKFRYKLSTIPSVHTKSFIALLTAGIATHQRAGDFFANQIESYFKQHTEQMTQANNGTSAVFPLAPFARNTQPESGDDCDPPPNQSMNVFESLLDMLNVFTVSCLIIG